MQWHRVAVVLAGCDDRQDTFRTQKAGKKEKNLENATHLEGLELIEPPFVGKTGLA
jgi:hypothetical protein